MVIKCISLVFCTATKLRDADGGKCFVPNVYLAYRGLSDVRSISNLVWNSHDPTFNFSEVSVTFRYPVPISVTK